MGQGFSFFMEIVALTEPQDFTRMLHETSEGSREAADRLFPLVYDELRRLAQSRLENERAGHTLQATALVHETYLKLIDIDQVEWQNRAHFFAVAATAIRRLLVDYARARGRDKRGGGAVKLSLDDALTIAAEGPGTDLIALHEALERFGREEPERARVVELRFFGGLTGDEIAEVLGVDRRTVTRYWLHGRAWLYRELREAVHD